MTVFRLTVLQPLLFILQAVQLVILSLLLQKLLVAALFLNLTLGKQDDIVCMLDGGSRLSHS